MARLLTVVTTLRPQERDVLDYLTDACTAYHTGAAPPSLRPQDQPTTLTVPLPLAA